MPILASCPEHAPVGAALAMPILATTEDEEESLLLWEMPADPDEDS